MQFSYISAVLATMALSNAVALPHPEAVALVPADNINELEARDPQIGIGIGVDVNVQLQADISAATTVVKQQCTNWSCGCQEFQTCFTKVCDQYNYSDEVVSGLKSAFKISASVSVGVGVGVDISSYKKAVLGYCKPLTNDCFESYCAQQGYSTDIIAQLRIELNLDVSVGS
ncbi:hypothetical protein AC579_4817 [Pseudocercospora musae]|uniref:Hydrophobin n=1 Tax=Pseudocercospora musae TaxID=113226 RepID=A0A139IIA7_9PEZI|nr:hypothetical protein AC579_4817 [Pseudocercospora musae]